MKKYNSVIRNPKFQGKSHIHWPQISSKTRGRFCLSQNNFLNDGKAMGIYIVDKKIKPLSLLAYLNSKFITFFVRLQTKDRGWQAGNIARIPIPATFLIRKENENK